MEVGGIEPPSARWLPNLLRPFLHCGLEGYRTGRSVGHPPGFPRSQSSFTGSVVSPYGPSTLLLPGCADQAPCAIAGHDDSLQPGLNQAARANCSLAVHFVPPFNESVATRVANSASRSQRRNQSAPSNASSMLPDRCDDGSSISISPGVAGRCTEGHHRLSHCATRSPTAVRPFSSYRLIARLPAWFDGLYIT